MSLRRSLSKIGALFRRRKPVDDLAEEIRAHLEMEERENLESGMPPEEAHYAALRRFGNVALAQERSREMWGWNSVEVLVQDLRYGFRMLAKNRVFTAVVVVTLALGIGANTAIFSLTDAVVLKMLPVSHSEQLVQLEWSSGHWPDAVLDDLEGSTSGDGVGQPVSSGSFSYSAYRDIRDRNHVFSETFAVAANDILLNVGVGGRAESANGRAVSGNYFIGLGVSAAVGRTILPSDDAESASPVALLSFDFWNKRFGGDPSVLGKTVMLDGMPFTVVGVTPPEFFGLEPGSSPDISVPLSWYWKLYRLPQLSNDSRTWWMLIDGRLRPGVTEAQARAELGALFHQHLTGAASTKPGAALPVLVTEGASQGLNTLRRKFSEPLRILTALVGLVLLIACANVASLLVARAAARQKEIAVRLSLGAGRRRLIRQLVTECILLAVSGGAVGLVVAIGVDRLLLAWMSSGRDPVSLTVHLDLRALAFTAGLSVFTGILFGLAPALRATRVDLTPALKDSGTTWNAAGHGPRLGKGLVAAQIAICLLLLVGAGLFVRTLRKIEMTDIGFNREHLLLFDIQPGLNGYEGTRLGNLYQELQRRLAALPGVQSVSLSQHTLIAAGVSVSSMSIPGYTPAGKQVDVHRNLVSERFFETLGIRLVLGRTIDERDDAGATKIAVVNQKVVHDYFHGDSPIGRQIDFGSTKHPRRMEIVGVVGDTKYGKLRADAPPTVYIPYPQDLKEAAFMSYEVRTARDPKSVTAAMLREARAVDKDLPLLNVKTETEQIQQAVFLERLFARLTTLLGLLGLVLACVGLYGIMAHGVARRTKELGIRMALGAQQDEILGMVLRETFFLIAIGVAIGLAGVVATTRLISSFLFGLEPTDPLTISAATLAMVGVVALAGYLPARTATRIDPMVALRHE